MRVVSGIQPTGNLHLGNYLGAIRRWAKLQHEVECLIFLADLHAITIYNDPAELRRNVNGMAAALIACGIDPDKTLLFNHARVPAHPEMAWILSCTARVGWLNRMTQFKEKSGKNREGSSVGLYAYPILQAADVLLYHATHVPVGEDQKQHVELMRDIALKFNADYDVDLFTVPEPHIGETAARIMSLRDGQAKMSKTDPSDMSRINLDDDDETIAQKIRKAKTDAEPLPDSFDALAGRPEAANLVTIYAALTDRTPQSIVEEFAGKGFGQFKPALADLLVETIAPIRARLKDFEADPAALEAILVAGSEKAAAMAAPTLEGAYRAVGLPR
ncbi:MAG TPA: tryptophan--tRNA ligase [Allosphingosinicella sp.]|nr:tryptophan--tRNA ligase [Allosphingosinicella sp.]